MPNKTIYVKDESLWLEVKRYAVRNGQSLSEVITEALEARVSSTYEPKPQPETLAAQLEQIAVRVRQLEAA